VNTISVLCSTIMSSAATGTGRIDRFSKGHLIWCHRWRCFPQQVERRAILGCLINEYSQPA
jgi:hypothetical protein